MHLCSFQGVDGPRPGFVVGVTVTPPAAGSVLDVIRGADAVPIGDPQTLRVRTWVNGGLHQDTSTADMIFGVADLAAFTCTVFPLEPGHVIATGTPSGVGVGMGPTRFLADGDVIRIKIDRPGAIEHAVVAR